MYIYDKFDIYFNFFMLYLLPFYCDGKYVQEWPGCLFSLNTITISYIRELPYKYINYLLRFLLADIKNLREFINHCLLIFFILILFILNLDVFYFVYLFYFFI